MSDFAAHRAVNECERGEEGWMNDSLKIGFLVAVGLFNLFMAAKLAFKPDDGALSRLWVLNLICGCILFGWAAYLAKR